MTNKIKQISPQENERLLKVIIAILERGNDAEIKQSKNGIKVLEISKKVRMEIVNE